MEKIKTYDCFLIAFKYYVDQEGHGIKKELANNIGVSSSFLSQVYNETKGTSLKRQEKIAKYFQFSYTEFVEIGKQIKKTGKADVDSMVKRKEARMKKIEGLQTEIDYLKEINALQKDKITLLERNDLKTSEITKPRSQKRG